MQQGGNKGGPYPPHQPQYYPPPQQQQQYPPPPQGPPPPYQPMMQHPQHPQHPPYGGYPYPSGTSAPPQYSMPATGTTVVVKGAFDPGARFDGAARANIPPPPPGCPPNAAQQAAMQGHAVVGTQRKDNFFWGETGGGWTW